MSDVIRAMYRRAWWALFLRGAFSIAIAGFILLRPLDSIATFALLIAFWALFNGIVQTVQAFELRTVFSKWWVVLLGGLIGIVFGVAALYNYPGLSLAFAIIWATWWLFLIGTVGIYAGLVERKLGLSWGWTLAFGILSIIAGLFAIMAPPVTLAALMGLIAGFALVSGVVLLMGAFRLSAAKEELGDALHGVKTM